MSFQHKQLAQGRWKELSFFEQMANIGSEVVRAINWKNKGRKDYANLSLERALELFDLTKAATKEKGKLKELSRAREILVDYFDQNIYGSKDESWQKYFYAFNYAVRAKL